jgi:FMN phosphatase YigB (HAD superfamily)
MKVIFDFDDVIFNAKAFKDVMYQILGNEGYSGMEELYEKVRERPTPFSLLAFLEELDPALTSLENLDKKFSLYERILGFSEHLVHAEVTELIQRLGKDNCYIVTNGVESFQQDKIRRSVGQDLVREVIVVSGSKREAIEEICKRHSDEEVIFVDDKSKYFNDINWEACNNLKTVLFNENGLENLEAEIERSVNDQKAREVKNGEVGSVLKEGINTPPPFDGPKLR